MKTLEELKAALAAATQGEWKGIPQSNGSTCIAHEYETGKQMNPKGLRLIAFTMARGASLPEDEANAHLIALMHNNLPALIECAECLQDVRDWLTSGRVDGVGFDEPTVIETITAALTKLEQPRETTNQGSD